MESKQERQCSCSVSKEWSEISDNGYRGCLATAFSSEWIAKPHLVLRIWNGEDDDTHTHTHTHTQKRTLQQYSTFNSSSSERQSINQSIIQLVSQSVKKRTETEVIATRSIEKRVLNKVLDFILIVCMWTSSFNVSNWLLFVLWDHTVNNEIMI